MLFELSILVGVILPIIALISSCVVVISNDEEDEEDETDQKQKTVDKEKIIDSCTEILSSLLTSNDKQAEANEVVKKLILSEKFEEYVKDVKATPEGLFKLLFNLMNNTADQS